MANSEKTKNIKKGNNMSSPQDWNRLILNNFLNPSNAGMSSGEYAQLKKERAKQWANFVQTNKTTGIR
jgi:hypothetical protein